MFINILVYKMSNYGVRVDKAKLGVFGCYAGIKNWLMLLKWDYTNRNILVLYALSLPQHLINDSHYMDYNALSLLYALSLCDNGVFS